MPTSSVTRATSSAIPPELRETVVAAQQKHRSTHTALRDAVHAFVDQLRDHGVPHDKVLLSVRSLMAQAGAEGRSVEATKQNARMLAEMLDWCEERWHTGSRQPS